MRISKCRLYSTVASIFALTAISQTISAAAFQMILQNASNLGTAYAGTAALAEDASTNFYNTAGLTRLPSEQIAVGGILTTPQTKVNVTRATSSVGTPLSPSTGTAKPNSNGLIPFMHYAKRIDENWHFGFSAAVPFGAKANYRNDSIVRYTTTRAEMKTIDLAPSLAYKFDNGLSLGAGPDALYMLTKLDLRIGTGNVSTDGFSESTFSNWGLGYHLGALYEIDPCTRLGVQYHSRITVKTRGESLTQFPLGIPTTTLGLKADFKLPDSTVLSAYHAFNDRWAAMADLHWTHWSVFKQVITRFQDGSQFIGNFNYKNAYRVSAGGSYQYNEIWRFRAGLMFDQSPIPAAGRTLFIPNENYILPAIGAQYRICKTLALDFAYVHLFFKKANNLNVVAPTSVNTLQGRQNIQGSIRNRIDAIGLQLTWDIQP